MKKIALVAALLTALMLFVGCGKNKSSSDNTSEPTPKSYTVTWINEKGVTIATETLTENKIPSRSYTVTDTAEWDYTFEGWATSANGTALTTLPAATKDMTYYAVVSAVKQRYTVTFNSNGGSSVAAQTVEYGEKATVPTEPTYEDHKFMGWCYDINGNTAFDFDAPITENVEVYAIWNEIVNVKALLSALLSGYELNPFSYIPESMRYDFSENLVDAEGFIDDYSSFVNVSDISYGFGEQWNMVLDNILQSNTFFSVLTVIEGVSGVSVTAFNDYFDKNPANTAHYEFESGVYNVTINFDGEVLFYVLDYTATLPVFGEQTVQIALSLNADSGEKSGRIQIGDANALSYTIQENSYEFAIKYLGVRRAAFSVERYDDGSVKGSIYEFLTVSSAEIASASEFYITEDYVSVVGNKASGMLGFTGYITELYGAESGKLLGYEVNETLSSIVYNTLWFNLSDVYGINSVKSVLDDDNVTELFFVNGSKSQWESKKVGSGFKMFSRRFDIEFRTQYVYSYDAASGEYTCHAIEVPMLFVQEENYSTLVEDIESANDLTVSVTVSVTDLDKILSDYDTLIPAFIENKDSITAETIVDCIGDKITLSTKDNQ